jgi:hypothetical protein
MSVDIEAPISLIAEAQSEDGYIKVSALSTSNYRIGGTYILSRSENLSNKWEELTTFKFDCELIKNTPTLIYKDYAIEHNKYYIYSLIQVSQNKRIYTNRLCSTATRCDYDSMFLSDEER